MAALPRRSQRLVVQRARARSASTTPASRKPSSDKAQLEQRPRQLCANRHRVNRPLANRPRTNRSPAKKPRRRPLSHFPLMQLPTEIRLQILRILLWQEEPLRKQSSGWRSDNEYDDGYYSWERLALLSHKQSFRFYPAILRVCRQLYMEGEPVLYDNTFGCDMWYDEGWVPANGVYSSALLDNSWDILEKPMSWITGRRNRQFVPTDFATKIRKLDLDIYVSQLDWLLKVRMGVRNFVTGSRSLRQLSHLKVNVHIDAAAPDRMRLDEFVEDATVSKQEVLNLSVGPLALMRCLKSVRINGISEEVAVRLANTMTQRSYVDDLPRMINTLRELIYNTVQLGHCRSCTRSFAYLDLAEQAVDLNDLEMFKNIRASILRFIEDHQARERAEVHSQDPVPNEVTDGRYDQYGKLYSPESIRIWGHFSDPHSHYVPEPDNSYDTLDDEPPYEELETEDIEKAREAREKQDPMLKTLREIWRWKWVNVG